MEREAEDHADESIYHGNVPVLLKSSERDDKQSTLTVAMSFTTGQPRNQKVLHIQVTDESDAYLLYTLDISEDDFHSLKAEQSILVDFPTFPSKFVELLRQCQASAGEEHPRFLAMLSTQTGVPVFSVTETNPFRQLTHIALRMVAGNDAAIKRYLAGRVADFKSQLLHMRDELGERTQQLQETAELASAQTTKLRSIEEDHVRTLHDLEVRQQSAIAEIKKAAAEAAMEQSRLADQERSRVVERSETELSAVRLSLERTSGELAKLTAAHHELELRLRERSSRKPPPPTPVAPLARALALAPAPAPAPAPALAQPPSSCHAAALLPASCPRPQSSREALTRRVRAAAAAAAAFRSARER